MADAQPATNPASNIWTVPVGDTGHSTTVAFDPAPQPAHNAVVVFGHGASSYLDHHTVVSLCSALRAVGIHTARYNFLYTELKKGPPDRMPKLLLCLEAVARSVQERHAPAVLLGGGHSMGGRVASVLAAQDNPFQGLILCGYPLHPAGHPEKLRSEHLSAIRVPVICANGTRDELCTRELMDPIVVAIPTWTMHWLEHADHSFHVRKSSGRTEEDVRAEFGRAVKDWFATL